MLLFSTKVSTPCWQHLCSRMENRSELYAEVICFMLFIFIAQIHYSKYSNALWSLFRLIWGNLQAAKDKHPSEYLRNYDFVCCNMVTISTLNFIDDVTDLEKWRQHFTPWVSEIANDFCLLHLILKAWICSAIYLTLFSTYIYFNSQTPRNSSGDNNTLNIPLCIASAMHMISWKGFTRHMLLYHLS